MTTIIDTQRHLEVIDPMLFASKRIDVIGCGATGSKIALSIAKLGFPLIHIHDFDIVEEHNIANQVFSQEHIGRLKTEALAEIIKKATGTEVVIHSEKVDGTKLLGTVVFVLTDTMASRKEIFEKGLKYKLKTELLIETRMGADSGRIYTINPNDLSHIQEYEKTLYTDEQASTSLCKVDTSMGPTADIISGFAVWQMIKWINLEYGQAKETELKNEVLLSLEPIIILDRSF